jgi:ABC-type transporter Mla subunit MlaD
LRSAGGFELERVLADAYPILQAIDPRDVRVVLDEMARAGEDLGPTINRSIVNGERVLDVQAAHDDDTRRFIEDLADLTEELATRAPDLVDGAEDLNVALPVLTEDPEALTALLSQLELTSAELADLFEANTAFIDSVYGDGQAILDVLYEHRSQIVPLVIGLRQYVEVVGGAARIPVGDGTVMAAVKGIIIGEPCEFIPCNTGGEPPPPPQAPVALPIPLPLPTDLVPVDGLAPEVLDVLDGEVSRGSDAVIDILTGLAGGPQ